MTTEYGVNSLQTAREAIKELGLPVIVHADLGVSDFTTMITEENQIESRITEALENSFSGQLSISPLTC